ncbi:MAG: hypothetical protein HRU34_18460 [Richelia sp.]|nr:hypothetical protein [Richelia sp.]CDN13951.1 hypothetical protein RintRC_6662 [Richelia intracellularis]
MSLVTFVRKISSKAKNLGVAESDDDFTKFSTISSVAYLRDESTKYRYFSTGKIIK